MKSKWIQDIDELSQYYGYKVYENGDIYTYWERVYDEASGRITGSRVGNTPRKLKGRVGTKGYLNVDVRGLNGNSSTLKAHRIVGFAFIPNPENKPQINHKDGNKLNNCVSNLEWATNGENQLHAYKLGLNTPRSGEKNYQWDGNHSNCQPVRQLDLDGNLVSTYKSLAIAGRAMGVTYQRISRACRKDKERTLLGYKWELGERIQ